MALVTGPKAHTARNHSHWVADPGRTPQGRAVGRGRDAPHPGMGRLPLGRPRAAPQRGKPARKSARCGVNDSPPRPQPPHPQPVGSGPWPQAPRMGIRAWKSAQFGTLQTQARGAPLPGALMPPLKRANSAPKSAHCWLSDGSRPRHPPHPQPLGIGTQPHGPRRGGWPWESAKPRTPHTQARGAPPPPGPLILPPQRAKPSRESARCGVGDGSLRRHPPRPQPVGSRPKPHALRTGGRAW